MSENILTDFKNKQIITLFDSKTARACEEKINEEVIQINREIKKDNKKSSLQLLFIFFIIIAFLVVVYFLADLDIVSLFVVVFFTLLITGIIFIFLKGELYEPYINYSSIKYPLAVRLYKKSENKNIIKLIINDKNSVEVVLEDENHFVETVHIGYITERKNTTAKEISINLYNDAIVVPYE